jgi:hypothetical protein
MKLHEFTNDKRASGRTSRLIAEAKKQAEAGKAVYVIAKHWQQLQKQIDAEMPRSGIKCEPDIPNNFDWQTLRVRGSHPNCVWLIDHYWIEWNDTFAAMFAELTRFDE